MKLIMFNSFFKERRGAGMESELRYAHLQGCATATTGATGLTVAGRGDSEPRQNAGLFQEFCSRDVNVVNTLEIFQMPPWRFVV